VQVEDFLERSAGRLPGKVGLVCAGRRLTYGELDRAANGLARSLQNAGLRRGDRVAIFLENSVESVVAIFATLKAGGVFMVVNPTTKSDKLGFILNNSRAAVLVTDDRRRAVAAPLGASLPHTHLIVLAGRGAAADFAGKQVRTFEALLETADQDTKPAHGCIDIDLAALIYTSGSTGTPKGVMLTHLNIVTAATSITTYLENDEHDVILNVLPLSFDYGLYQVLMAFKVGATVVLERSFAYPHAVLETAVAEGVTGLPIVPTMSAVLLQLDLRKYDLSRLRYVTNTASALPVSHVVGLRTLLPHAKIFSMYGLTECKRVSFLPPDQIDVRPFSVGKGMPNEEVYVVDDAGRRVQSGIGELVIRGSHVMKGYWEMPEETDRVLKPGPLPGERVLYSGDLFRIDDEGYLYFLSRKDDIIKTRGEKVSPREVENVIDELDAVAQVAVIGVEDPVLGQAVKAILTLKPGAVLREQEVLRHCADRLEQFMVPRIVEFRDALPQTPSGKIDRQSLRGAVA
jgi:amino acid adenylation domain-containing protein